jgi:hypothetical protein
MGCNTSKDTIPAAEENTQENDDKVNIKTEKG